MNANVSFCQSLTEKTEEALSQGASKIVFWGYNNACITVLNTLLQRGLPPDYVIGLADVRKEVQGKRLHNFTVVPPDAVSSLEIDTLVVTQNSKKEHALAEFVKMHRGTPQIIIAGLEHLAFADPGFDEVMLTCLVKSYATGYPLSLVHLYQAIQYLGARGVRGDVAEFGICKGGTVVFIRKALDKFGLTDSEVYGFDIFEGFPKRNRPLIFTVIPNVNSKITRQWSITANAFA